MNITPMLAAAPGCPLPQPYCQAISASLRDTCPHLADWHQTHPPRGWLPLIHAMMIALKHVHTTKPGEPPLITLLRAEGGHLRVDHKPCSKAATAVIRELQDRVRGVCQHCGWPCDRAMHIMGVCPVCAYQNQ